MSLLLFLNADEKREGDGECLRGLCFLSKMMLQKDPWSGASRALGEAGKGKAQIGESGKRAPSSLQ